MTRPTASQIEEQLEDQEKEFGEGDIDASPMLDINENIKGLTGREPADGEGVDLLNRALTSEEKKHGDVPPEGSDAAGEES